MLSIEWLSKNDVNWDFQRRTLIIEGWMCPLKTIARKRNCRQVVAIEGKVIPAFTQGNVECRVELVTLEYNRSNKWNIEHNVLGDGVKVAPTLVSDEMNHISVRVINSISEDKMITENYL